jgi:hypothetical protein
MNREFVIVALVCVVIAVAWVVVDHWLSMPTDGKLPMRAVRRALRKRYGRTGYRIDDAGLILVSVRYADSGEHWWGPFGNVNDPNTHAALARILAE